MDDWLNARRRKPLVLRGARQVGKTWLVRDLAARSGREIVEVNFERDPGLARHFAVNRPEQVLGELSLVFSRAVTADRSLLFLDEIQEAAAVLSKLRWFAEELPQLPVVAAGSLLDMTLADGAFSAPVGRIAFRHVEPLGFGEFLRAHDQQRLQQSLDRWRPGSTLSLAAHQEGTRWFERYAMVGGMPAVVVADVEGADPASCRSIQRDLIATYRADFAKYAGRMERSILDATLLAVGRSLGQKFVYARASEGVKQHQAKHALELLARARLCHLVRHSAANGLPFGAEVKDTFRKAILVDIGVLHALVGTPASTVFPSREQLPPQLRGQIAEQLAGQQLRLLGPSDGDGPELYYWQREGGRPGEIDYLLGAGGRIVPIELKAGTAGSMKSLHHFMFEKRLDLAVRIDSNPPSLCDVDVSTTKGDPVRYRLLSVPAYMTGLLGNLLATI